MPELGSLSLIGVLAVDVGLAELARSLSSTPLYQSGYAFVWDDQGYGVVHKKCARKGSPTNPGY